MDPKEIPSWKAFAAELLIYAVLVTLYFFLAFHFLGGWFKDTYDHNRTLFATAALGVMIGQAVGLEIICSFLFWILRSNKKKRK